MLVSIKSLIVGDVIESQGFTSRVVACQHYVDYAAVTVEFVSGNKDNFDYMSHWGNTCQIQGCDKGVRVKLVSPEFIPA